MKYKAEVQPQTVTCESAEKVLAMAKEGPISLPFKMQYDEKRNTVFVCVEEENEKNRCGVLKAFGGKTWKEIKGDASSKSAFLNILNNGYSMKITGVNPVTGYLDGEVAVKSAAKKTLKGSSERCEKEWERILSLPGADTAFPKNYKEQVMLFFTENNIPEALIYIDLSQIKVPRDKDGNIIVLKCPDGMYFGGQTPNEKGIYFENSAATVLREALSGNAILLQGPKSVGKNFLMEWIAFVMGAGYYEISVHPDMTVYDVLGDKTIDAEAASHLSKEGAEDYLGYIRGEFAAMGSLQRAAEHEYWSKVNQTMRFVVEETEFKNWARQKEGKRILMVNEINFGNPTVLAAIFNRVAEDRDERFIDVPGEGRIFFDENCILSASMNVDYVGTMELNEAMRSRFGVVEMQSAPSIKGILKDKMERRYGEGILPDEYYDAADRLYRYMQKRTGGNGKMAVYGDKATSIRGFVRAMKDVVFDKETYGDIPRRSLVRALNVQLRCLGDTPEEKSAISQDINSNCGDL